MERQRIQPPGWGPGGCNVFGLHFSEHFVKGIDTAFFVCFCYMVISEVSGYNKYRELGGCSKPFEVFWIGHFSCIVVFRFFYYLEKHFYYRLAVVFFERDTTRLRRARFWAVTMLVCKLLAFCGFLFFTIIGSVWFVEDGECLSKLDESLKSSYSEIRMVFWLMISFSVCLIYALRLLMKQVFTPRALVQGDDNENFNMFMWDDQLRGQQARTLTAQDLDTIKKSELRSYDELKRPSRAIIEMTTLTANQPVPLNEQDPVLEESKSSQDEDEPTQGTCAVCIEEIEIGEWYKKLPKCEHCFHAECIDQWLTRRATCPVCREEIFPDIVNGANARAVRREIRIRSGHRDREARVVLRFTRAN